MNIRRFLLPTPRPAGARRPVSARLIALAVILPAALLMATACSAIPGLMPTPNGAPPLETANALIATAVPLPPLPKTEVIFTVQVPENTPPGEPVYLSILDEVTGLAINAENYPLQEITPPDQTARVFSLTLPFSVGAVITYRYERQTPGATVTEHTSDGEPVRYRLYIVDGPGAVNDQVSRWTDTPFLAPRGRVAGQVTDAVSGQPIPDILVSVGGEQARSASDGSFLIDGLAPGVHNLAAYATDGSYRAYQQGAEIAPESMTPAPIALTPAPLVNLIFIVTLPEGTPPAVPVRLAGSLHQAGNTFATLSGGVSVIANRMPVLTPLPDGRYSLTIALPAGAYLRYKYTLGDGFWNAEHTADGAFKLREIVVPPDGGVIDDEVETWRVGARGPIVFDVQTPPNTPAEDNLSLQLNPLFGWMEPLPMWRLGPDRWAYVLYSPLNVPGLAYRYCRNEQCGSADDLLTSGPAHPGRQLRLADGPQNITESIDSWIWAPQPGAGLAGPPADQPAAAREVFVAGIEFQPAYHPSWLQHFPQALEDVRAAQANSVFLSPTWTYAAEGLPLLEAHAGQDASWLELTRLVDEAKLRGLGVGLYPQPRFSVPADEWWLAASRDFGWWQVWFEQYRTFALHHADLAARRAAPALILGGGWLGPALPGGQLVDGSPSGVPADAEKRWRALLAEVRSRYNGNLLWALPFESIEQPPPFLDDVDWIYLTFSAPLAPAPGAAPEAMAAEAARLLDAYALPVQALFDKPLILAVEYPSAGGAASGCISDGASGCLSAAALARPQADIPGAPLDLDEQLNVYRALLAVVNQRAWISGFVARGYYPPVALADKSASVHGKPAGDLLSPWFSAWQPDSQP